MTDPLLFGYLIAALILGTTCLGAVLVLAHVRRDELAHQFLWLYIPCSVSVLAALLLVVAETQTPGSTALRAGLVYFESFVARYGVMLALPLVAHRVFGVRGRDASMASIVLFTFAAQHVTEIGLGGTRWDARGDVFEDVVFAGIFAYTVWIGISRRARGRYPPFTRRFFLLLAVSTPAVLMDTFFVDGVGWRWYPLTYGVAGVALGLTLLARHASGGAVPIQWDLSDRESEVLRLVRRGYSTREIGERLHISPNTVKTHVRAIFDKSGYRTRAALIANSQPPPVG